MNITYLILPKKTKQKKKKTKNPWDLHEDSTISKFCPMHRHTHNSSVSYAAN